MSTTFSEREMKLLAAACQCFEGQPKLDIDKFSSMSGLTKGSARNAWAALKKKLYEGSVNTGASNNTTPAGKGVKKRPPPVALPASGATKDDEDEPSPTKKSRTVPKAKGKAKTKKGKAKKEEETEDEQSAEDEEEDGFIKVIKVKDEISDEV